MAQESRRPSAALIVALVALVAALAGSAVALPGKNNVDKNDIKKNAVKSKAIKNSQVKAPDIKTGAVGAAEIADGSVGAAELTDPEAVRLVGTPGQPGFENGGDGDCIWRNANAAPGLGSIAPVGFYKDADGRVHLSGVGASADEAAVGDGMCGGADTNRDQVVFVLPPDYRPAASEFFFPNGDNSLGAAVVATDLALGGETVPAGSVVVNQTTSSDTGGLSGISFRAAPPAVARANAQADAVKLPAGTQLLR